MSRSLENTQIEMEPESTLRDVFSRATDALAKCPRDEGLTYLRLRSAELGGGMLVGDLTLRSPEELKAFTAEAAQQFPDSARILTVWARASRDAAVARRAVAADPAYSPARVALADILADAGDWREAEKAVQQVQQLGAVSDGLTVLARVELAKGDARAARAAAKRALMGRSSDLIEPDARDPRPVRRAHAVAAVAALELRRFQEAAVRLSAADPEDRLIRDILRHPPRDLAKALRTRRARTVN